MPSPVEKALRWSERYIKTDMVYLARSGFWLTVGQGFTSLTILLLAIAFANLLPKETYGTYKYILSVAGLFSVFTLPGMTTALIRAVARGYDASVTLATKTRARFAIIGAIVGLFAALYYHFAGNNTLAIGIFIISVFLPVFDVFFGAYNGYLQGKQQFRTQAYLNAVIQIVSSGSLILALFLTDNLYILLLTYFGSLTAVRFACWWWTLESEQPRGGVDPEMIPYAKHLSLISALGLVASQADTIMLFHFLGPVQVALYTVAIAPAEHIKSLISTVNDSLLPRLAGHSESSVRRSMLLKCIVLGVTVALLVGIYIIIAPLAFRILFPKYLDSIAISQLYAVSLLASFFTPMTIFLQAHGKIKEQYLANTLTYLFQLTSMAVGVIWFGLIGLVAARILTRFVSGLLIFLFYSIAERA